MSRDTFQGKEFDVIDFDDVTSGERVIEFVDPERSAFGSLVAVTISGDGGWGEASVSISPRIQSISAEFMRWALDVAHSKIAG
ncbi:hypothetical protein [Streptomyces sp. S465]|uniref:hypothetical protein n=1 Tax=Streptomyces sp. S465 TaxID=2979468 RepID=UPI0022A80D5A|nr:hypothetical protein [Streptomyces sp. S465]WAP55055.1 hypothetical protein N6H00_08705 [Streptomyces sp. S465]